MKALDHKILFWVLFLFFCVYLPFLLIRLKRRKEKQKIYEERNRDAVKVYLALDSIGNLTVYSVDGREPVPFYETARQGFYLSPGEHTIGVQYHHSRPSEFNLSGFKNFNIEPRDMTVTVERG